MVLGLVPRGSPWGQYYLAKKEQGHRFYEHATFYNYQEVVELLKSAGFAIEKILSTLFQRPNEVKEMESPREHFSPDAGFTVVVASKIPAGERTNRERRV